MSRDGAVPSIPLTGWVFFDRHRQDGFTIRWRRAPGIDSPRSWMTREYCEPLMDSGPLSEQPCEAGLLWDSLNWPDRRRMDALRGMSPSLVRSSRVVRRNH
jgi:hypothetical protein